MGIFKKQGKSIWKMIRKLRKTFGTFERCCRFSASDPFFHGQLKTSSKFIHIFHNMWEKLSSGAQAGSRRSHPAHLSLFVYPLPVT